MIKDFIRKPEWLKGEKLGSSRTGKLSKYLKEYGLFTVCESAKCPNKGECFERGTATFMILGNICTRNCKFCAVEKNKNLLRVPDVEEANKIAKVSKELNLKHIVVTTVTRDDLADGGAGQFVKVVEEIRKVCDNSVSIEVLISDLQGNKKSIKKIVDAEPDIINHNIETIENLYSKVRPMADYRQSLELLRYVKELNSEILTKSGFMVGLGETKKEIFSLMDDLKKYDVDFLTIGQYLAPSKRHIPVKEYIHPDVFSEYQKYGEDIGFMFVESGPLVRSSYHAERARKNLTKY